ncbi:MAG: metallophosphoesterase [Candidatus Aenigmarchaeota archaeon]|nr:metallophosphoesterase [Candidatus Aenigmarchaeota archaeon]
MEPRFVTNKPALMAGRNLVIADLHIGVEFEFFKSGIKVPSSTETLMHSIEGLIKETKPGRLVILGDIKHKVPGATKQEIREVPDFLSKLSEKIRIDIVPGNHDDNIGDFLPDGVRLHESTGFRKGEYFFVHGHAWPSEDFLKAKYVFVGHEHPQIEFRDKIGYRFVEQVWVRTNIIKERIDNRYEITGELPELIVLPRFNHLCGGISMNQSITKIEHAHKMYDSGLGPLVRASDLRNSDIYLLDGTLLGKLKGLC